jgi:hypothetical protein
VIGKKHLMKRGMNSALAIHRHYAYVGSRTDGTHPNPGVFVFNVKNPRKPHRTDIIAEPYEANRGETSRELRVWPEKNLLLVLNLASNCSPAIHICSPEQATRDDNIRFFDIKGKNAAHPKFLYEYVPSQNPHEFFLWDDPKVPGRALLYMSTPGSSQQLLVSDISKVRKKKVKELAQWTTVIPDPETDNRLHSLSVSNDGRRGYVSYLGGGFLVIDTSQLAKGKKDPEIRLITPPQNRVHWGDPGAHSSVKLPHRPYVLVTDEVYGKLGGYLADHGCPWGWTRIVNIEDPTEPRVVAHYKIDKNKQSHCDSVPPDRENFSSWSSHNPTLTRNLALITWHSGGLQAVNLKDPRNPTQAARFKPRPLPVVLTEDPALSSARDKVVMWSYPIIRKGLVYVTDIRNGLYILRYHGPHAKEIRNIDFLEGNSNLGDAPNL